MEGNAKVWADAKKFSDWLIHTRSYKQLEHNIRLKNPISKALKNKGIPKKKKKKNGAKAIQRGRNGKNPENPPVEILVSLKNCHIFLSYRLTR